ncbi:MAG: MerR family transcriptional regulator [Pacificimonas sp.]
MMAKSADAFRTISEVSEEIGAPQHVLRFWETKFKEVSPLKRGGGRRYYRPEDVDLIRAINGLLYTDGYTIKGVQKLLKDQGVKAVTAGDASGLSAPAVHPDAQRAVADPEAAAPVQANDAAMMRELKAIRDRLSGALDAARIS